MDGLWKLISRIAHGAVLAGAAMIFAAAVIVTAEVLIRKAVPDGIGLINYLASRLGIDISAGATAIRVWVRDTLTFSGSDEISGYLFAIGTSWSLAYALVTRGHVRIDVLYGAFPPRIRAVLDIFALICLAIFIGALTERALHVASTNLAEYNRSNTNLRIPLAWSQLPWMAGILLFMFAVIVAILRALLMLVRGDVKTINEFAGVSTQDEEIESELKGLGLAPAASAATTTPGKP